MPGIVWSKMSCSKKIWTTILLSSVIVSFMNGFGTADDQNAVIALVGLFALHSESELVLLLYTAVVFVTLIVDVVRMVVIGLTVAPQNMVSWLVFICIGWALKVAGIVFAFICKRDFYEKGSLDERTPIITTGGPSSPPALDPSFTAAGSEVTPSPSFTTGV
ncbi:hypothetical protein PAPYR_10355 [Paratrimastix pyriformis]|uniref:Uncharacterized protein n=1 Tax=Paratrimastix pyriformis TaxID=342808 RepID=A0ABQ8UAC9_9EUKA|nr:hypothetical protein PAPYR_10355 [Paratrimastix pyriformis]